MRLQLRTGLFLITVLSACASASETGPTTGPAAYVLTDGTRVSISAEREVRVSRADGSSLVATPATAFPTLVTFNGQVESAFGSYEFTRRDEVRTPASRFLSSQQRGGIVEVRWETAANTVVTLEVSVQRAGEATRLRWKVADSATPNAIAIPLTCDAESTFAGFGAQYDDTDQRGDAFALWVEEQGIGRTTGYPISGSAHTTYYPMPWWLDWRGFGVLVDTTARTLVDLCKRDPNVAWVEVEDGAAVDLLVLHGPRPRDVIRELGNEVGRPSRPPDWAFSPWIAIQHGREEVLAEADALTRAQIPFSALWVQDWVGGRTLIGDVYDLNYRWVADPGLYPDLPELVRLIRTRYGARFLTYANPFVLKNDVHWTPMADASLLIRNRSGAPYEFQTLGGVASLPDFTRAESYAYVKSFLRSMVNEHGFDGWMSDFGEWLPADATLVNGEARLVHNVYPSLWQRASREVMDELRSNGDWVLFSRSGWTRAQKYQQIVWIGDQEADFSPSDGLPTVVPALINLGLSGVPFATHDVAGYSGGPSTQEVFARWTELAAFGPVFRTHTGLKSRANWSWSRNAETTNHFRRFARIHEALGPELRALADEAARSSLPIVRHLALEFESDAASRRVHNQFMLGPTLLVAPVTSPGATMRQVYLPPGTWFHLWTGRMFVGPATMEIEAPIGSPPVFSRDVDRPDLRAI